MTRRTLLPILAAAALLVGGCRNSFSAHGSPDTIETAKYAPALGVDLAASTKLPSGLYYRDLVVGTGPRVTNGMNATVAYVLWTTDGQKIEASPIGEPYTFRVGARAVIPGWDFGIVGMNVGGKRQLIVPPELAYGANGQGPIGPNTILVFTVEVQDAK
jgi:FKBP-type peptidyl-prolyl cis-trans isomerase